VDFLRDPGRIVGWGRRAEQPVGRLRLPGLVARPRRACGVLHRRVGACQTGILVAASSLAAGSMRLTDASSTASGAGRPGSHASSHGNPNHVGEAERTSSSVFSRARSAMLGCKQRRKQRLTPSPDTLGDLRATLPIEPVRDPQVVLHVPAQLLQRLRWQRPLDLRRLVHGRWRQLSRAP
jgi:hypothetical protein